MFALTPSLLALVRRLCVVEKEIENNSFERRRMGPFTLDVHFYDVADVWRLLLSVAESQLRTARIDGEQIDYHRDYT